MSSFAAWSGGHVKDTLILLRSKGHDRKKGGSGLEDVVTGKVSKLVAELVEAQYLY